MIKFFGVANLTTDVTLKEVGKTKVASFSIATNESVGTGDQRKETAHYFNCEAWDTGAERLASSAKKGDPVYLTGIIRQDRWNDKETGEPREKVKLRVLEFRVVTRLTKAAE